MTPEQKAQALVDYAGSLTVLKPVSGKLLGLCPVHQEKTPSFWVSPEIGKAKCFGCGFSGDALDLYQGVTGEDFIEAKKALGLWDGSRAAPKFKPRIKPPKSLEYSDKNKRAVYLEAVKWLKLGYDIEMTGHEKYSWSSDFIATSVAESGRPEDFLPPITHEMRQGGLDIMADLLINKTLELLP